MTERKWVMTEKELNRRYMVGETIEGRLTIKEAATILSLSERQVYRVKSIVKTNVPFSYNPWKSRQVTLYEETTCLISHINGAVDRVRSRLRGGSRRGKKRDLFESRYTLLKGVEKLADWEKERLNWLFYRYPELKRAWGVLKEDFRAWYRETDRSRAEEKLAQLEEEIRNDSLYEFKKLLYMLANWIEGMERGDTELL